MLVKAVMERARSRASLGETPSLSVASCSTHASHAVDIKEGLNNRRELGLDRPSIVRLLYFH